MFVVKIDNYIYLVPFVESKIETFLKTIIPSRKATRQAKATLKKDRRVNIRLSAKDLEALQRRAAEEGIPYQTLMASVLHKYVSGRLVERPTN